MFGDRYMFNDGWFYHNTPWNKLFRNKVLNISIPCSGQDAVASKYGGSNKVPLYYIIHVLRM